MPQDELSEEAIFLAALERPVEERAAYLAIACRGNPHFQQRIEALLQRDSETQGPLDRAVPWLDQDRGQAEVLQVPGARIGPYKLLQQIGEGGMGTVYMAEQSHPVLRKVALKVIRPGMDSRQVIARFEAERQALALMDHPSIAKVLDAGTTPAGRPYFVMELVKGVPITTYCDENRLPLEARLRLLIQICHAVQHAHQRGVIHRDLKPTNVLVTAYDHRPVPKVIDFGVAKATEGRLTERTMFTGFGQILGTLEYMSPEQAQLNAMDVDTRGDIYSLGVILYELLTGTTPFDKERLRTAAFDEMLRIIREEEPPKPSTRMSVSERRSSLASNRALEPKRLSGLIRGELDWIVMKTLEKDRNRRYETAKDLAADVERYLADEPVQACPPSLGYRARKFLRRNKGPVVAGALLLLAIAIGMVGTTWGMIRATKAERAAVHETQQKSLALVQKNTALAESREQLFQALVNQARAERKSGRIGQRFEALKAIRKAARIRINTDLRAEATAALVLPDAELAQEWERSPEGSLSIAFDGSFQFYARTDKYGEVILCQVRKGKEQVLARLPGGGKAPFQEVVCSSDARFVAGCYLATNQAGEGGVRVWNLDGAEPAVLLDESPGTGGVRVMVFHPTHRQLAVGHADESISVFDLISGRRVQRLAAIAAPTHLAYHPREARLAAAVGNSVQIFDTITGRELTRLNHSPESARAWHVTWHCDGRRLATSCNDRKIHIWDTETATEVMSPWSGHSADGLIAAFNHTGDRLVSSDWSGQTHLWDTVAGRKLLTLPGLSIQFSSDDRLLGPEFSASKVRLWRIDRGGELRVLRHRRAGSLDNIHNPVIHPDGCILAASTTHRLCFFDLASGEELATAELPIPDAASPAYFDPPQVAPDVVAGDTADAEPPVRNTPSLDSRPGGWMMGGSRGLSFWPARRDVQRPEWMRIGPPQSIVPNQGAAYSRGASASADGRVVAVPQGQFTLLLDRNSAERKVLSPQYDARHTAVSPDGRWLVSCSWSSNGLSKSITIWDTESGCPVHEWPPESYTSAKFSPDGRWVMIFGDKGTRLHEVGSWREVRRLNAAKFAFSPDGRLVAINDQISVIRLLEMTTGREVARLTGPDVTWYTPACFTPDGTRLVTTCSEETALYVWDLRLIRQQLKEMGLDWDWPDFPPANNNAEDAPPSHIEIVVGDWPHT